MTTPPAALSLSPVAVAQGQLDAYNKQDLDAYMAFFAPNCVIASFNGGADQVGAAAIRARYEALFAEHPKNQAKLIKRIAFGDHVIDHEEVRRTPGGPKFEVVAIYSIKDGLIVRVDFLK